MEITGSENVVQPFGDLAGFGAAAGDVRLTVSGKVETIWATCIDSLGNGDVGGFVDGAGAVGDSCQRRRQCRLMRWTPLVALTSAKPSARLVAAACSFLIYRCRNTL